MFQVNDCVAPYKGVIAHVGLLETGALKIGMPILAEINQNRRKKIANNHSATHLMHWALHEVLGEHIKQAGSVVDEHRLRFDFNHHKALTQQEMEKIEDHVNDKIRDNQPIRSYEIPYDEAQKKSEIKQFFGEKYNSLVRVIDIDYSQELCGGTHTKATGDIGFFRIIRESSIAAGIRRIEAVTGVEAEALSRESDRQIAVCAATLKIPSPKLLERIEKLLEENKQLLLEIKAFKKLQLVSLVDSLLSKVEVVNGNSFLSAELELSSEELRACADEIMTRAPSLILALGTSGENKCQIIIRVSDDQVSKGFKAQEIIKAIAPLIEGSGGGKPNSAQAGGMATHRLKEALAKAKELIT